jgi:hypothetical protein
MKFNPELAFHILKICEEKLPSNSENSLTTIPFRVDPWNDDTEIGYHINLLDEEGYLISNVHEKTYTNYSRIIVYRLTLKGCKLLDKLVGVPSLGMNMF